MVFFPKYIVVFRHLSHTGAMARINRIALLVETSREAGRAMLRGIAEYARAQGNWTLYHHERTLREGLPTWMRRWEGDGIIARIENPRLAREIRRLGRPTVDLRGALETYGVPRVQNDQGAIARAAAEHLLERGFQRFAYCGLPGVDWADERGRRFAEELSRLGYRVETFPGVRPRRCVSPYALEGRAMTDERALAAWVAALPRPAGILAASDSRAQHVLAACAAAGLSVPDDAAVLGIGNDELVCEMSRPSLSSVISDSRRIGYLAASVLDRMLHGDAPPRRTLLVPPLGVAARASTDVVAVADADTAAAVRLIRERACEGLTVRDILDRVPISRSTLERRFRLLLGRTPKAEILRVRLRRVRELLASTAWSLEEIARRTGFGGAADLARMFRLKTGQTPGEYRTEFRPGTWPVDRPGR